VRGFPAFSFKEDSKEFKVINKFVDDITGYYKSFDESVSYIFSYEFSEKDVVTIKNMLYVIIGFLMSECRKEDYTFLGVVKLLKTFMGNISSEYNNDKTKSVFYRIWEGMSEESKKDMPDILNNSFNKKIGGKMEHKKYDQVPFGLDIVDILERKVQELAKEHWENDNCPPEFWVSLNNENMDNQSVMITVNHNGYKFTERLFPRKSTEYGYNTVINQMINMYNQTM
jgi:hypothetical protein